MSEATTAALQRKRRDAREQWLPITTVLGALAIVAAAVQTWATDRSELHANSASTSDHEKRLRVIETALTERATNERAILDELRRIRNRLENMP